MELHSKAFEASPQAPPSTPLEISIDVETKCDRGCKKKCKHALVAHACQITIIGLYWQRENCEYKATARSVGDLNRILDGLRVSGFRLCLGGHNFKFDLRILRGHGFEYREEEWTWDSQLEAATSLIKIPQAWLKDYEKKRKALNKKLPKGFSHRTAERHSLKTLAPFFLGVEPFWEDPTNHDNETYVLLDCRYSYRLHQLFGGYLRHDNLTGFLDQRLLPWTKMLLEAEVKGVRLDMHLLETSARQAEELAATTKYELDKSWEHHYEQYELEQKAELAAKVQSMQERAIARLKPATPIKVHKVCERHDKKFLDQCASIESLNIDSPPQLTWLLRDQMGLDITDIDEEESTGKAVLQRLAASGRTDIGLFLQYRAARKLSTAFFPTYKDLADASGVLHTSFNSTGTRTGRLSSSTPNLQQVPGELHRLFIARDGYALITRDLSAIEPCIVAYYTDDPVLCDCIVNGGDFHSRNAKLMMGLDCDEADVKKLYPNERALAKTCGLALMYGAGPMRIKSAAQQVGFMWSDEKCQDIFENFKDAYQVVFSFKGELDARFQRGESVANLLGRKHSYPNKRDIHMKGFNTLVQSTASDLLLESTRRAWNEMKELGFDTYPLLWVHDEIVFEAEIEDAAMSEEILEKHLTQHVLTTLHGDIPLRCAGFTGPYWSK